MRLKIGAKVYPSLELDAVSLRDIILFDSEVRDLRADLAWTWGDVERVATEMQELPADVVEKHPDRYFFLATMVWAVRRINGEAVSFSEAVDVDPTKIDFLDEPEDHKPGKPKGAKKSSPRKASAPAVAPAGDEDEPTT